MCYLKNSHFFQKFAPTTLFYLFFCKFAPEICFCKAIKGCIIMIEDGVLVILSKYCAILLNKRPHRRHFARFCTRLKQKS
jgi:hypothetical protein